MAADDRTSRTPPPSFAPGAPARPVRPDDAEPIVVGRPSRPTAPARPARSPAARAPQPAAPSSDARPASSRPPTIAPAGQGTRSSGASTPVEVPGRAGRPTTPAPAPAPAAPRSTSSRPATSRPAQPIRPPAGRPPAGPAGPRPPAPTAQPGARRHRKLAVGAVATLVLVALLAWPIGLAVWANGKVQHTPALSGAANTPGTTYLLTGSDSRGDGGIEEDGTEGSRTDTILLLHVPENGPTALISLPRDTYAEIPGNGASKLNAAFSWGQAPLLVQTVEGLTGLTVDHYAEIGMAGVEQIVDAVGGVNLCHDADVNDVDSGMVWTAGCHDVDGTQALAFARMRKADPTGRRGPCGASAAADRGRHVQGQAQPAGLPAGSAGRADRRGHARADRRRRVGHPRHGEARARVPRGQRRGRHHGDAADLPIDYRPGGNVGSTVLLDPDLAPAFWAAIRDGSLPAGPVGGMPGA